MKLRLYLLFLTHLISLAICKAQNRTEINGELISARAADSISRNAFGKMVAGTDDIANLANYVSFVPTDGKFTLSGNYFFQSTKKDTTQKRRHEYFAIGFNTSGSIVGGTVATLFETGKLNTGVDFGLKLSWRINHPNIGSLSSENLPMIEKRNFLKFERNYKMDSAKNALALVFLRLQEADLTISESNIKLTNAGKDTTRFANSILTCTTDTCRLRFTDSLLQAKSKIFTEQQKIAGLNRDIVKLREIFEVIQIRPNTKWEDRTTRQRELSKKYGLSRINLSYEDTVLNKIWKDYEDKIYEVEMARPVAGMRLNWLSAIINWSEVTYRTYYDSLPFVNALTKVKSPGLTLGLQANFYTFYKPVHKASLFNIALLFKKTNNLEELSTSKLTDEVTIVNDSVERKLSTDYTVYTDPIEIYNTMQLSVNYYRFFGKDLNFGWHAFASADWRDTKQNLYDAGAGFIFGLNSPGAKRLLNVEIFAKYKDVTQQLVEEDETGWKQLQFGLSVAIPFMIYKN